MIVKKVEYLETITDEYVYDIETDNGTYYAGDGILLKNTDSCYVNFTLDKSKYIQDDVFDELSYMVDYFKISKECAEIATSHFKKPIELEFEKVMFPFVIYEKKRYAFQQWLNPENPEKKLKYIGLAIKRRDSCPYVKEVLGTAYSYVMQEVSENKMKRGNVKKTIQYIYEAIEKLLNDKVPYQSLIISKSLKNVYKIRENNMTEEVDWTKPLYDRDERGVIRKDVNGKPMFKKDEKGNFVYNDNIYKIKGPHVQVAIKLRKIDPDNSPRPPDRVPYIFIMNKKATLQHEIVEHPDYINGHTIDTLYYFEHQLREPISDLIRIIGVDPDRVFKELITWKQNKNNNQRSIKPNPPKFNVDEIFGKTTVEKKPTKKKLKLDTNAVKITSFFKS